MLFKRLNRTDAERVFAVFQANAAGIAADDVVQLELTAASVDGVKIIQPAAAPALLSTVGIADAAIANGAYGLVQIYGYRSTSRVNTSGSTYALGQVLTPVAAQDYLTSMTSLAGVWPAFICLETVTSVATGDSTFSRKIFIRCM
jgi:hypothetical protein